MTEDSNNKPDLDKLRRLALVSGVLLITYVVAGIEPAAGKDISPLGFPFRLNRPDLVPVGLVLVSLYSTFRFWLYGIALRASPIRRRRHLFTLFHISWNQYRKWYEGGVLSDDADPVRRAAQELRDQYPVMAGKRIIISLVRQSEIPAWDDRVHGDGQKEPDSHKTRLIEWRDELKEDGGTYYAFLLGMEIPFIVRWGAYLQDLDYFSPILVNLLALSLWLSPMVIAWVENMSRAG